MPPVAGRHARACAPWGLSVGQCGVMLPPMLFLLSVPKAAAAGGGGGGGGDVDEMTLSLAVLGTASFLVALGVAFEHAEVYLIRHTNQHTRPVVDALFAELTLLGAIGLLFFAVEQSGLPERISAAIFGEEAAALLTHVLHEVHMVLFFVMVVFLVGVLVLVRRAHYTADAWKEMELLSVTQRAMVANYHEAHVTVEDPSGKSPAYGCCAVLGCGKGGAMRRALQRAREQLVYASFRERFLRPPSPAYAASVEAQRAHEPQPVPEGEWGPTPDGRPFVKLDNTCADSWRKKLQVYAFRIDRPVVVEKHWGRSAGGVGDWLICGGLEGDVYCCPNELFKSTYRAVDNRPNVFQKTERVLATRMNRSFYARGDGDKVGPQRGLPGSFLVQTDKFHQYSVTDVEFRSTYELVQKRLGRGGGARDDSRDLPPDTDFSQYLTIMLGHSMVEIVEVSAATWVTVEFVLLLAWAVFVLLPGGLFTVGILLVAYGVVVGEFVLHAKLSRVRDALTAPQLLPQQPRAGRFSTIRRITSGASVGVTPAAHATIVASMRKVGERSPASTGDKLLGHDAEAEAGGAAALGTIGEDAAAVQDVSVDLAYADLVQRGNFGTPAYENRKLRTTPNHLLCWKSRRPPNRHEDLFWGGVFGPSLAMQLVRVAMLVMAIFGSVMALMLMTGGCSDLGAGGCVVVSLLALVPVVATLVLLPSTIGLLVLCSNVEQMKKSKVIADVLRAQKTQRSMRALRMLSAMKLYARRFNRDASGAVIADQAPASPSRGGILEALRDAASPRSAARLTKEKTNGAAERVWGEGTAVYARRKHELGEVFALFDRHADGHVSSEDLGGVLDMLGLAAPGSEQAMLIVQELDADGSGEVEFNEFLDWMAAQEEANEQDTDALAREVFNIIDVDKSGDISQDELRATLASLGEVMTGDDIMAVMAGADQDGNGTIDFDEFKQLLLGTEH